MIRNIKDVEDVISKFKEAQKVYFKDLKPSMLEENLSCVYAIINSNDDRALYVGRTTKLRRRLYTNHLQGNTSTARLKKYILEDNINFKNIETSQQAKEWIKDNCYFKYIEVNDNRERGHIEGLLGYILNSFYIEKEH